MTNLLLSVKTRKKLLFGNKTFDERFGAKKIRFLLSFTPKRLLFTFFSFLAQKTLKMKISTSMWGAQHPNAGQNIQQIILHSK